jgi:hypothetical protein
MKLPHPTFKSNDKKAHALLCQRAAQRVVAQYRVSYSTQERARLIKGEGTLKDLSKTGCKVVGIPVPALGSSLTLFLDFEDGQSPLCLAGSIVGRVAGGSFAVKFPAMRSSERKRVQEAILRKIRVSSLTDRRTEFRIV